MKEKTLTIIEIIIIFILMIGAIIFKFLPEYKASKGSSDTYINTENFQDLIEVRINDKPNFALVITDKTISNILFFDSSSSCLYNKNIEAKDINSGVKEIIKLLIENNYLKQNSTITLTTYKSTKHLEIKNAFLTETTKLNLNILLQETKSTIEEKAESFNITGEDELELLKEIEMYSKNIIRRVINDVAQSEDYNQQAQIDLDENLSHEYADNIYKKIENYSRKNNIINQEISNQTLQISLIPANKEGTIFPDDTSWYYIKESKVYLYISITQNNKNYSYCYQGSIDDYKKGIC